MNQGSKRLAILDTTRRYLNNSGVGRSNLMKIELMGKKKLLKRITNKEIVMGLKTHCMILEKG